MVPAGRNHRRWFGFRRAGSRPLPTREEGGKVAVAFAPAAAHVTGWVRGAAQGPEKLPVLGPGGLVPTNLAGDFGPLIVPACGFAQAPLPPPLALTPTPPPFLPLPHSPVSLSLCPPPPFLPLLRSSVGSSLRSALGVAARRSPRPLSSPRLRPPAFLRRFDPPATH